MQLFYTHKIEGEYAYLEEAELRHATKTLRKKIGDCLELVDGKGNLIRANLIAISKKEAQLRIITKEKQLLPWSKSLHLAVAPTKNIDRIEWFLEKAVEIGINQFTPVLCQHSERKRIRIDRLEKIAIAASKQSYKFQFPKIAELTAFSAFLQSVSAEQRFIAHCYEKELPHLFEVFEPLKGDTVVLIGPEGDFSPEEVSLAITFGYQPISLGASRLRTETAALAACHSLQLKLQT